MEAQVLQCLQATLSPDLTIRQNAEEQLKQLFLLPEGGLSLARILLSSVRDLSQRQSAGVLLQKYIDRHWSFASASFEEPPTPFEVKAQIRPIIFHGLSDPNRKIRSASAFALSTIAKFDWPDEYPDLLSNLVQLLGGSADSVHGAMRVITEFVKNDLSEDQLLPVVRDLVPALLNILGNPEAHTPATRASTINVFRQVIRMLETVRDEHPQAVRSALESLCPQWFGAFQQLLGADAGEEIGKSWEYLGIRIEIFRTFSLFLNAFPKVLTPDLPTYLRLSTQTLLSLLPTFQIHYLSTSPDAPEPPSPTSDVGFVTQKMDLDDLACAIFDFLTPAVRQPKSAGVLAVGAKGEETASPLMDEIIGLVLDYTQVTRANEEEWLEDTNAFVQDEDDETEVYGLRVTGHDLVGSLIDKWPRAAAGALQQQTTRRLEESSSSRAGANNDWWKPVEATLALLGGVADDIRDLLDTASSEGKPKPLDVEYLFDQVIPGLLDQFDTPFLQGRAFVFASQFASSLSTPLAGQYLSAAVSALSSENVSVPVKISAVKTIKNFCRFVEPSVLQPQLHQILSLLLPLLQQTEAETLYLILETIRATLSLEKGLLNEQSVVEVAEQAWQVWLKYTQDPVLTAIVEELVESITSQPPDIVRALVLHLSPKLAAAISEPTSDDTVHLPGEAIQLATSLIRARAGPIEAEYIGTVTSAILGILRTSDDMDVIQHGVIHVTLVVRKDCDRLIQWHDSEGGNGINAIYGLLARLLAPTFSESGGIFVGDLIMHLFRKAGGAIGPVLPDLLGAIAQRLATAKMPTFAVSLVLPFAYLFGTEYTTSTIDLLSSFDIQTPEGATKSGLHVVLENWCETVDTLAGSWDIRVSAMGMSKLFVLPDERLRSISVKGDMIITTEQRNTIMTRSKTKNAPIQYTQIPFPVKALKIILKEVQHVEKGGKKGASASQDIDEDDGDEEWDDDDPLGDAEEVDEFGFLSSWLDGAKGDDTQDDDEDLKSDPLAQVDMGAHLNGMLRGLYTSNANGIHEMIDGLSDTEKGVLRGSLTI